jgi:class 3 adenylate cyclase/predicted ATPase
MDLGGWLRRLGLGQYEATFRESAVDAGVLPELTDGDLEKLGVPLGHRKRLLKAIASLGASGDLPPNEVELTPPGEDAAERRNLTVMFCDLVGSTALSARLDPEDMRVIIRAYQDSCSGVVARYDGFVAKFMCDGVLTYFGFPRAHEDDAERAVHAGLEIADAVAKLETRAKEKLQARIGIATGLVVVGDLIGEGSAREQTVVGDTPNLAARLQGLAEPGTVVVAGSTRRLLGDRFKLRNLGRREIKGLTQPAESWTVEGISSSESRFEAAHAARLTGFVGREAESVVLLDRQNRAWKGDGQIVLISGEAGIGKSRFAAWLAERVASEPHTHLTYQCSPYHRDSALYPFTAQLERTSEIKPEDAADKKLDKLEAVLTLATLRVNEIAPLFASLLSIPSGTRYPPLGLSPAHQRRQTLAALLDQLEGLARQKPVLALFEDVHWADATTLEVLDLAVERVRPLPVLMLITFRPEFESPWAGLSKVTSLVLGHLDKAEVETLVERVAGGRKLPAEVMAQIVAKTDGVPLFVEELTKTVQESGLLVEEGDRYRLDGPLPALAIPATLQDSLMARLDRLAPVKEIAQIGAAVGRDFSFALLREVTRRDAASLQAALAQLEGAELLFRSGAPPDALYSFKHALVQDTAYGSLLKSRRQVLHKRIAETLRDKFPAMATAQPEVLAHHFTQASLDEAAIEWWGKAGDQALRRSAYKEAIAHLGKAIEMADKAAARQTSSATSSIDRLRLQAAYSNALLHGRGMAPPETTAAFARARELAASVEDPSERFPAYYGLWVGPYIRAELTPMREVAEAFLSDAARWPGLPEVGIAHRLFGTTCWFQGDYVGAREHLEQALAVYDHERDRHLSSSFAYDPGVAAKFYLGMVFWALGHVDRATRLVEASLSLALQGAHIPSVALARFYACVFAAVRRKPDEATPHAQALLDLGVRHGLPNWLGFANFHLAWAARECSPQLQAEMRDGLALEREINFRHMQPLYGTLLAEVEAVAGRLEAALATVDEQLATIEQTGERWFHAEAHRARGEILLKRDPADIALAEEAFKTAIDIARRQGARSFELSAAIDLAKLYRSANRNAAAYAVLAHALDGFTPSQEFPEIGEARTLLAALNP